MFFASQELARVEGTLFDRYSVVTVWKMNLVERKQIDHGLSDVASNNFQTTQDAGLVSGLVPVHCVI